MDFCKNAKTAKRVLSFMVFIDVLSGPVLDYFGCYGTTPGYVQSPSCTDQTAKP